MKPASLAKELRQQGIAPEEFAATVAQLIEAGWKSIGKNVKGLREQHCRTQEELAIMSGGKHGVSVRTIARIESGEQISEESLRAIAGAFNVSVDDLKMPVDPPDRETMKEIAAAQGCIAVNFVKVKVGEDIVESMNGAQANMFQYDPPDKKEAADALTAFQQMLTDYIDCWDEMSPSDKFEAAQIFGDLLKDLKEVGCTLYQAKMYSKYSMTSTQSTVSLKTLVFCARKLDVEKFVGFVRRSPERW